MIFVTVGTHEQPFNRLVQEIDRLVEQGIIQEEVRIQSGYCTYEPKHCKYDKMIPYAKMQQNIEQARIVITHGGPATFIMPLQVGKIPIVVPRNAEYGEHVNNHQIAFAKEVETRMGNIIVVEDVSKLGDVIAKYDEIVLGKNSNAEKHNHIFVRELEKQIDCLFEAK